MAKHSRKLQHQNSSKVAASVPEIHPDATIDPYASLESTFHFWNDRESTNAPEVGEERPDEPAYASGGFQLFEKFLHGRIPLRPQTLLFILTIMWIGFISWLFLQDNEAGKISDVQGLKWFGIKAGIYSCFYVIVAVILAIFSKFSKK